MVDNWTFYLVVLAERRRDRRNDRAWQAGERQCVCHAGDPGPGTRGGGAERDRRVTYVVTMDVEAAELHDLSSIERTDASEIHPCTGAMIVSTPRSSRRRWR